MIKKITHYNKKTLLAQLEKKTGCRISAPTLWKWEKKGIFAPAGYIGDGARKRPIYDATSLETLITKVKEAKKKGDVKLTF